MLFGFTYAQVAIAVAVFVASTLVTTAIVGAFVVMIAADHFVAERRGLVARIQSRPLRIAAIVAKNLLGVLLIAIGSVLVIPGVPGQGLLTILIGLLLLDIPGKRRLELGIVRRPRVLRTINRLRKRYHKPPLLVEKQGVEQQGVEQQG